MIASVVSAVANSPWRVLIAMLCTCSAVKVDSTTPDADTDADGIQLVSAAAANTAQASCASVTRKPRLEAIRTEVLTQWHVARHVS